VARPTLLARMRLMHRVVLSPDRRLIDDLPVDF
jgi:hypothetical protein